MYEKTKISPFTGADCLTGLLASGFGQHDGTRLSSIGFTGTTIGVVNADLGRTVVKGSGMSALVATGVQTAVRVPTADAYVPGAPPRGAPV
jgi:hypothetical protein